MSHLLVRIWAAHNVSQGFVETAEEVAKTIVEPQVNFDILTHIIDTNFDYEGGTTNWDQLLPQFVDYVESSYGTPANWETQLLLINDGWYDFGAGRATGVTHKYPGPWDPSESAFCGVNCALKAYVNSPGTCGHEDGDSFFKNTVAHEILHTVDCPHEKGAQQSGAEGTNWYATPLQTWYSANNCGFNDSLDQNCNWTEYVDADGLTTDISYCATSTANSHFEDEF